MVNLRIIMEGQAASADMSLSVADNAESLRQSVHSFFSRVLDTDDINVSIYMGNGYRNAARRYSENPVGSCPVTKKTVKYGKMRTAPVMLDSLHSRRKDTSRSRYPVI